VIGSTAGVGLITANILRKRDNLVKLVGTSVCVISILALQVVIYPETARTSLSPSIALGLGLITVGAWSYNYCLSVASNSTPPKAVVTESEHELPLLSAYQDVSDTSESDGGKTKEDVMKVPEPVVVKSSEAAPQMASWMVPDRFKLLAVMGAWIALAMVIWIDRLHASPYTSFVDMGRFFLPLHIQPAKWGRLTFEEHGQHSCIEDWSIAQLIGSSSHKLVNLESEFRDTTSCPIYPIPDGGFNFHMHPIGAMRPYHLIAIQSFLATQRFEDGHRLIVWVNTEDQHSWEGVKAEYAGGKYSAYIEFRQFAFEVEAKGTCFGGLEGVSSDVEGDRQGLPAEARLDLDKVLLLSRYGGVWLDDQAILMRDLTPL
jgi:hypothetical protein